MKYKKVFIRLQIFRAYPKTFGSLTTKQITERHPEDYNRFSFLVLYIFWKKALGEFLNMVFRCRVLLLMVTISSSEDPTLNARVQYCWSDHSLKPIANHICHLLFRSGSSHTESKRFAGDQGLWTAYHTRKRKLWLFRKLSLKNVVKNSNDDSYFSTHRAKNWHKLLSNIL